MAKGKSKSTGWLDKSALINIFMLRTAQLTVCNVKVAACGDKKRELREQRNRGKMEKTFDMIN